MSSLAPVNFTLSESFQAELLAALQKSIAAKSKTVTVSRPCAEATWNALMAALKGPSPANKKKGGKTSTSVRQKSGRPTGSSNRSASRN